MTALSIIQSAATVLDEEIPSVVFSSTERTWIEMGVMLNTCARQILEEYDWQRLTKSTSVTGDGTLLAFPLPSDYDRMVKDANLWGPNFTWYPSMQVFDFNQWLQLQSYSIEPWEPRWMLYGGNLNIMPVLPSAETLTYGYISNLLVKPVTGPNKTEFTLDTDSFVLDERLLRLSLIWNWKKAKGFDFSAELIEYEEAMNRARFKDPGARQTIYSGRNTSWRYPTGQSFP